MCICSDLEAVLLKTILESMACANKIFSLQTRDTLGSLPPFALEVTQENCYIMLSYMNF